jgi:hypothetical protein
MAEAIGSLWVSAQAFCCIPATRYSTNIPYSLVVASAAVPFLKPQHIFIY